MDKGKEKHYTTQSRFEWPEEDIVLETGSQLLLHVSQSTPWRRRFERELPTLGTKVISEYSMKGVHAALAAHKSIDMVVVHHRDPAFLELLNKVPGIESIYFVDPQLPDRDERYNDLLATLKTRGPLREQYLFPVRAMLYEPDKEKHEKFANIFGQRLLEVFPVNRMEQFKACLPEYDMCLIARYDTNKEELNSFFRWFIDNPKCQPEKPCPFLLFDGNFKPGKHPDPQFYLRYAYFSGMSEHRLFEH